MSTAYLLGLAVVAIASLLFLVIKLKMPAFVAILLVAGATALAGGIAVGEVIPTLTAGMGKTLGSVAIIVGLGAMLGRMIEASGGAERLARTFTDKLGQKRVIAAVTAAAFVLGIPVFFDVGFIILAPIVFGFAAVAGISPLRIGLPVAAVLLAVHVVVPPHPGPVAAAATLGTDPGLLTIIGLLACIPMSVVCFFVSKKMNLEKYTLGDSPATAALEASEHTPEAGKRTPGAGMVLALILIPLGLIMVGTTGAMLLPEGDPMRGWLGFVGAPAFALMIGVLLAYVLVSRNQGWDMTRRGDIMDSALPTVAVIIFVTGAGGVFANVLIETGVGAALSGTLAGMGMPLLLSAYLIAASLRIAQGSATVAILTTAGLVQSSVAEAGLSPVENVLVLCAIAFGGYIASHINDSGFWIVTRYLGLSVADGIKTWTLLSTIGSVVGFATVAAVWAVV
ncbi:GntP family transporter [Mobilicoccus caccae]|uniref:GntP family transporter n=1 Tax=Mobilicoccus caccae TaxID=1859295 RepID=A0ABQ6IVK1_9MICO|nr:GntP family transporter [Mobilicoccus caccae]GMA41086.1 GntP family transporter [Mobilicoccus caccae]